MFGRPLSPLSVLIRAGGFASTLQKTWQVARAIAIV
jgi:hypothetical protein